MIRQHKFVVNVKSAAKSCAWLLLLFNPTHQLCSVGGAQSLDRIII
jgi:hypothetical protein